MKQARDLLLWCFCLVFCLSGAPLAARDDVRERFVLKSADGKIAYQVDVWLPSAYKAPQPLPALVMLDGEYAFESAVQLSEYLQRGRELVNFIIVGVSYGVDFGSPLAVHRSRDYTPPVDAQGVIVQRETAYYRFIRDALLPELQKRYRIDPAERTLWSYSLSGSFAAWLNWHDPSLFRHTIIASGNLLSFGIAPKFFQGEIFRGKEGEAGGRKVLLSIDTTETPEPKILEDARRILDNKEAFPGCEMRLFVTQGESHASSWFAALPTALRFVYGIGKAGSAPANEAARPTEGAAAKTNHTDLNKR